MKMEDKKIIDQFLTHKTDFNKDLTWEKISKTLDKKTNQKSFIYILFLLGLLIPTTLIFNSRKESKIPTRNDLLYKSKEGTNVNAEKSKVISLKEQPNKIHIEESNILQEKKSKNLNLTTFDYTDPIDLFNSKAAKPENKNKTKTAEDNIFLSTDHTYLQSHSKETWNQIPTFSREINNTTSLDISLKYTNFKDSTEVVKKLIPNFAFIAGIGYMPGKMDLLINTQERLVRIGRGRNSFV